MNEQAIIDSYNLAVQNGYKKSVDEFKTLLSTNSNALNDIYNLSVQNGYKKSIEDYKVLMGISPIKASGQEPEMPAELKKKEDTTALPSGLGSSVSSKSAEEDDYFTGFFGDVLRGFDNVIPIGLGDFADDMARAVAAGYRQGDVAQAANKLLLSGTTPSLDEIQNLLDKQKSLEQLGGSKEFQDYQRIYEEEGKGVWGVVKGLLKNPTAIPEIMVSSAVSMATNRDAVIGGLGAIGTGAGIGAATAGTATLGVGAAPGAVAGALSAVPYAMGLASTIVETGSTFSELLNEELGGQDATKENVKSILENPEKLNDIRNKAIARGITIGVVDAFTGKLASGVGAKIIGKSAAKSATGAATKGAVTAAAAAGSGVEAVGGSAGEAAARALIGQEMDTGEILMEGIAEMPGGVRSTLLARFAKPVYKVNGQDVNAQEIDNLLETMSPADLAKTKIDIKNDYDGRQVKLQDKIVTNSIKEEVKQAQPNLNDNTLNAIVDLQKQLNTLDGNKTEVAKEKAAQIRAEIKNLQENPLPEAPVQQAAIPSYKVDGKEVEPTVIDELLKTKSKEELLAMNIQIENDTQGRVERFQEIIQQTKPTEQDAIQEQAAGQVPVQSGTGNRQEMAQGEPQAEPQVVAEAGTQEEVTPVAPKITIETISSFNDEQLSAAYDEIPINLLPAEEGLSTQQAVFDAYNKAKQSGKYPELVKTVEDVVSLEKPEAKTTSDFADELSAKYGVELELQDNKTDNSISIPKIVVPKDQRNTGLGTKVMEEVVQFADRAGKRLVLTPSTSFGGSSVKRLVDFYKSIGFVENKGKNKDFTIRDSMYRNPVPVAQEVVAAPAKKEKAKPAVAPAIPLDFNAPTPAVEVAAPAPVVEAVAPEPVVEAPATEQAPVETPAPAATTIAQPSNAPITIADVKVDFNPNNAIEVQKGTREDTRGGKVSYNAAITSTATDSQGNSIGIMTKRSDGEGILSFTLKDSKGRNINKGKAYPTQRDAVNALVEQVNRVRAKAPEQAAPTPAAPVVEVAAPAVEPMAVAPTPEPEPILVDGESAPILITEKEVKSRLPKFTKDNATEYDTDYKEDSMGREVPYISSLTVEAEDIDGVSIGTITRLTDEDKINSYTAEDSDRIEVGRGKVYDSEAEAIKALVNHVNKKRQKEFDKEAAKIVKAREKAAAKAKLAEEKRAAKPVEKKTKAETKRDEIISRPAFTPIALARQWLLSGGKLRSQQSEANKNRGNAIGRGVREETGMGGVEMRKLIGVIDNKNGVSPEVAAERIYENLSPELQASMDVQDIRDAIIEVLSSEDRKSWIENQDRETSEESQESELDRYMYSQLTDEERADFDEYQQRQDYYDYLDQNAKRLAKEYDAYIKSQTYQDYIEEVYGRDRESQIDAQNQNDGRGKKQGANAGAAPIQGQAAKAPEVDTVINEETGTLESALDFLDGVDKKIAKTLKTRANDVLLGIPLTVVQGMVKGLKVLVQGGMKLRDAIKKISEENNISQENLKDILDIASIQYEFNLLMTKADKLIANQKSKEIPEKKIVSNLDKMVRDFYKDLDVNDAQRKIMEREARARMGVEPRKAASIGRVIGVLKDITNVTRAEKLKIISRIRELGRDVTKDLASEIRELAASGKITATQAASIVARTLKINPLNEASVSNFVDYMAKVFSKADYVGKMGTALSQIKQAKKNIKTKIGISQDLFEPLNQLLSINPTLIPLNQLEKYLGILEDFSARKTVLSIPDRVKVLKQVNEILEEVSNEFSLVDELADRFNNYEGKVFNEDGNLSYAATIKDMIDGGIITTDEADLMNKYKSEILPQVEPTPATDAEIEADKKKEIKTLKELKIDNKEFPLPNRDEKEDALNLAKLIKELSVEDLMNLPLTDLKNIIKVIGNINNGYLPHYAKVSIEKLEAIKQGKILSGAIEKAKPLSFSKLYSRLKDKFTKKGAIDELIRANPLYYIDNVFGDFKTRDIFNSLLENSAQALSSFNSELKRVSQKIDTAQNKVLASFRQNPDKYLMSKFRMTAYMLQREYESNVGKKGVKPVADYLNATIKHIRKGKSVFKEADAEKLEKILKEVESYTIDEFYNTFNSAEKNAIKVMTEINASLGEKAAYTASVIRGNKVELMDNYFHHNVLHEQNPMDATAAPEFSNSYSNSMRPTTKAKSLIERTGALTPLNFDLFTSTQKGAKFVLLDYNMTSPIRTARRTLIQAEKNLESKGLMDKEKTQIFNAINNAYEEALENILTNNIVQDDLSNEVFDFIQKQGYRAALAGTTRFQAELASNIVNALLVNPKAFGTGIMNAKLIASANGYEFMKNAKSKQTSRLYASDALSGKLVDPQILKQTSGIKGSISRGALRNRTTQIYNLTLKKLVQNPVEYIADTMLTTPDKVVSIPLWFGSFMNEFKRITGEEVNQEMMINNDLDYMQKNADAIEQATRKADQDSVYSGAANNEFMGVLKGKLKPNQGLTAKIWNNFNSFMTNFMNFDYAAARSAVYNLFNEGYMTKQKAAAVLAGITTRSVIYQVMVANMGAGIVGAALGLAFDWEDEEEVDEKSYLQMLGRGLANVLAGYTVGRNFGNAVRGMVNFGVEKINEEYLDFLRNGEYDFYKDNIAYTYLNVGDRGDIDVPKIAINMAGAYTPALNTAVLIGKNFGAISSRVMGEGPTKKEPEAIRREDMTVNYRIPLEVAGNAGLIPFYKDVKRAVNDEIYKDLRKAANTPESSITTPDDYDKLKDLKELKNKTKNQEERRAIDKKIVEIVGSEEAKTAIDKQKEMLAAKKKRLLYDSSKGQRYDNESDMKRLNPSLWRKRFGPNSDWNKETKAKEAVERKLQKEATAREDKEFKKKNRGN